jgi:hypothetical protein
MTQTTFPEIQAAAEALESRLALTESEIAQMKESIKAKKAVDLAGFAPERRASR